MPVIAIFSASFCQGRDVAERTAAGLGCPLLGEEVLEEAARLGRLPREKLERAVYGRWGLFNDPAKDRARYIPCLRAAVAERIRSNPLVCLGFAGHLVPRDVTHVLRVCLVANLDHRVAAAEKEQGLTEKEARQRIEETDRECLQWTRYLRNADPWDPKLYDIVLPMHDRTPDDATRLICENARKDVLAPTPRSTKAVADFLLASRVGAELAQQGHDIDVSSDDGNLTITINRFVYWLKHLQQKLSDFAGKRPGVTGVRVQVGPGFHSPGRHDLSNFESPSPKVLLVDDEREFLQALSERLQARNLKPQLAYDGREALLKVDADQPDVMVLDLRMPEVDGMDVLRKVKKDHPETEVIILTGHGSEEEEETARQLGAFAYLRKPVDFQRLAQTMREAHLHAQEKRSVQGPGGEAPRPDD